MMAANRIAVAKTYQIYIGGKFPRTESGRYFTLEDKRGNVIANLCRGSRKDFRNSVASSHFNFSVLEPTGVVSILSSDDSSLLGLITNIAAAIVGGNTCVVLAPDRYLAEIVEQALLDTSTQLLNHLGGAVGTVLSAFR
jgi:hypothetical protein